MMKNILIVTFLLLTSVQADFVRDDALEVVNDTTTCLMWQDNLESKTVQKTWTEAIDHCEGLSFAGFDDWRLPNFNELYSIGDRSRYNPAIKTAFSNVVSYNYWSSTTGASDTSRAWGVSFRYGSDGNGGKGTSRYVRCVRAGQ